MANRILVDQRINEVDSSLMEGSIGEKWQADGVTVFQFKDADSTEAKVEVTFGADAKQLIRHFTLGHEHGHVSTIQDYVDFARRNNKRVREQYDRGILSAEELLGESVAVQDLFRASDRWQIEVEAWMRALEGRSPKLEAFHFIIDCLNSYRRSLRVGKRRWGEMLDLLVTAYEGDPSDIYDYVPIEPRPGEEPPTCGIPVPTTPADSDYEEPEASEDEDDDEDEGDGEGEDQEPGKHGGDRDEFEGEGKRPEPQTETYDYEGNPAKDKGLYDDRWLDQDIMDELQRGISLDVVAGRNGLDPNRLPPLVVAMYGN